MKKSQKIKSVEVVKLLSRQKIRNVKELDGYKLSICHPDSAGIDLGSWELYVALNPAIAAELDLPIVHTFYFHLRFIRMPGSFGILWRDYRFDGIYLCLLGQHL